MVIDFQNISNIIGEKIKNILCEWDGKSCIISMKEDNAKNWKQMEWIGWYFEYWCQKNLSQIMEMPYSKKYGNVSFDGFFQIPLDFKSHSYESGSKVPINDSEAIREAVKDFGCVGLIICIGSAKYDLDENFKKWHDDLKGGKTEYEKERISRGAPSRRRKTSFKIKKILLIKVDNDELMRCSTFQKNFRNSNGNLRRKKVLLDLHKLDNNHVYTLKICE